MYSARCCSNMFCSEWVYIAIKLWFVAVFGETRRWLHDSVGN
jgi:hypothetical protein